MVDIKLAGGECLIHNQATRQLSAHQEAQKCREPNFSDFFRAFHLKAHILLIFFSSAKPHKENET